MNDLLAQLITWTHQLECPAGVPPEALAALRRTLAAALVQQDPGLAAVVARPEVDAAILEAALAGVEVAAERTAAGVRLRFVREPYLSPAPGAERPVQVFGPFVDGDASLVQFRIFETARLVSVVLHVDAGFFEVDRVVMLLPRDTAADAELQNFSIPAGTVWVRAAQLVEGAEGFVALRVAGGALELGASGVQAGPGGDLQLALGATWRVTLVPEPAPPAAADGSDGDALSIELPTELAIQSDGTVNVTGALGLSGFGSALRFETPRSGPLVADQAIAFPYDGLADPWSIAGNRSALTTLVGECAVPLAAWVLPVTQVPPALAFEAVHGGSLAIRFHGELESRWSGARGRFAAIDAGLTVDALGLELRSHRVDAAVDLTLALWGPARSDLAFAAGVADLRFASRRSGADIVALTGGRLRNRWDLPRAASGEPFGCDAQVGSFSIAAEPDGTRRVACAARQPAEPRVHGLALENLYLQVSPVRELAFAGSGMADGELAGGRARLMFDVQLGEPMLPDPYAASWTLSEDVRLAEAALSIGLGWQADAPVAVQAQIERTIDFPEPRDLGEDSDPDLGRRFAGHLDAQPEFLSLLDLSTRDHHFGVALESLSDQRPRIDASNRLSVELGDVRLLMQPQVHWEPVEVVPNPDAGVPVGEVVRSGSHGGRTLVGASSVKLVPVLPGTVGAEIAAVANGFADAAALFSLPFGLRAFVRMDRVREQGLAVPPVVVALRQPAFDGDVAAAQHLRLIATGGARPGAPLDPARQMPGGMHQTPNLTGSANGLTSVLPGDILTMWPFDGSVPLHAADLSGYGLSCFSRWRREPEPPADAFGITQVRLDVLVGRTSYEVIEVRTVLAPCQSRVVRTIVLERRNSGRVQRFDSGWQPIDDGTFNRYVPFEPGAVRALRRIRHIRILPQPPLTVSDGSVWQPVRFDADADLEDVIAGGSNGLVPALDHAGYIQLSPVWRGADAPPAALKEAPDSKRFAALFRAAGPIGGAIDCRIRLGGTLEMQLSSLLADLAPDDAGTPHFAIAVYGSPTLPRAGQWSAVRIDGKTSDVSTVDPRRGVPVVRRIRRDQPFRFRDPSDARRTTAAAEYGLLLTTPTSRVLFPRPSVDPARPGRLTSASPLVADPLSLLSATSAFPRAGFALRSQELPRFEISPANEWRLETPRFAFDPPLPDVASGAGWGLARTFGAARDVTLEIDSAAAALPWKLLQPPDDLDLHIDPFPGALFTIRSAFEAASGALAGMQKPTLVFGPALDALQDIVNALRAFIDLPFELQVDLAGGTGANPSFVVRIHMLLRIGEGPDSRIDIGVGKFYGQFEITGELEAAPSGASHGRLKLEFQGDVQQGILPPLLYAGGMFRFAIEVRDSGKPVIELGLGTAASIGGDLIKGLLEVEATVTYGYTLIPETLKPGVMLGIEARAKLLAGLFGLSFGAQAMARIERLNDDSTLTIFADVRVAGSVQVAVFFKERIDFRTQFEQNLPLGLLELAAGVNPLVAAASTAVALI